MKTDSSQLYHNEFADGGFQPSASQLPYLHNKPGPHNVKFLPRNVK